MTVEEEEIDPSYMNFEFRNLRTYLFQMKRIELKSRSSARSMFSAFEKVKERSELIQNDPNVINPVLLFTNYLNATVQIQQKILPNTFLDIMNQINAFTVFDELIESRTEDVKNSHELVHQCVRILKLLLGVDSSNFTFMSRLLGLQNAFASFSKLAGYDYCSKEILEKANKYSEVWKSGSVRSNPVLKFITDITQTQLANFQLSAGNKNTSWYANPLTHFNQGFSSRAAEIDSIGLIFDDF